MDFVRARSQEQINRRQEEIIDACDVLFERYGYEGVNFKVISEMTSITRPTLYNYYSTKDEILLDLLQREILHWQISLMHEMETTSVMTKTQYSAFLTDQLASHDKMMKLLSILFTFLENNSRVEKLAPFKTDVMNVLGTVAASVDQYFPESSAEKKAIFVSAFFAYIVGLYPMANLTEKQLEAIQRAGANYVQPDFRQMCHNGILLLLSDL